MSIQIAQRIGRALGVSSATKTKELDEALREFVRSVGQGSSGLAGTLPYSSLTGVPATFAPSAHTHPNGDLTGYTAADVLAKLLTVDGAGSGLDADLLDGVSSAGFAAAAHLSTGTWTPTDASGAGLVLVTPEGMYEKHENLVIARFANNYPVTADASPSLMGGLPFSVDAGEPNRQGFVTYTNLGSHLYMLPMPGTSTVRVYTSAGVRITNAALSGKAFYGVLIYRTP